MNKKNILKKFMVIAGSMIVYNNPLILAHELIRENDHINNAKGIVNILHERAGKNAVYNDILKYPNRKNQFSRNEIKNLIQSKSKKLDAILASIKEKSFSERRQEAQYLTEHLLQNSPVNYYLTNPFYSACHVFQWGLVIRYIISILVIYWGFRKYQQYCRAKDKIEKISGLLKTDLKEINNNIMNFLTDKYAKSKDFVEEGIEKIKKEGKNIGEDMKNYKKDNDTAMKSGTGKAIEKFKKEGKNIGKDMENYQKDNDAAMKSTTGKTIEKVKEKINEVVG